jgi:hypothetical protein
MNLLTSILLGPITLPPKGLLYVFDKITEQADREFNDPAQIRSALVKLNQRLDSGEITMELFERAEAIILKRLDVIEERNTETGESSRTAAAGTSRDVKRHRRRRR